MTHLLLVSDSPNSQRDVNRPAETRPHRRPLVEYRRSDGRVPGEERSREILGGERVDAGLQEAGAQVAHRTAPSKLKIRRVK